jgi:hypothetical protein
VAAPTPDQIPADEHTDRNPPPAHERRGFVSVTEDTVPFTAQLQANEAERAAERQFEQRYYGPNGWSELGRAALGIQPTGGYTLDIHGGGPNVFDTFGPNSAFPPDPSWNRDRYLELLKEAEKGGLRPEAMEQLSGAVSETHFNRLLELARTRQDHLDMIGYGGWTGLGASFLAGMTDITSWTSFGASYRAMRAIQLSRAIQRAPRWVQEASWWGGNAFGGAWANTVATGIGEMSGVPTTQADYYSAAALGLLIGGAAGPLARNPALHGEANTVRRISESVIERGRGLYRTVGGSPMNLFRSRRAAQEAGDAVSGSPRTDAPTMEDVANWDRGRWDTEIDELNRLIDEDNAPAPAQAPEAPQSPVQPAPTEPVRTPTNPLENAQSTPAAAPTAPPWANGENTSLTNALRRLGEGPLREILARVPVADLIKAAREQFSSATGRLGDDAAIGQVIGAIISSARHRLGQAEAVTGQGLHTVPGDPVSPETGLQVPQDVAQKLKELEDRAAELEQVLKETPSEAVRSAVREAHEDIRRFREGNNIPDGPVEAAQPQAPATPRKGRGTLKFADLMNALMRAQDEQLEDMLSDAKGIDAGRKMKQLPRVRSLDEATTIEGAEQILRERVRAARTTKLPKGFSARHLTEKDIAEGHIVGIQGEYGPTRVLALYKDGKRVGVVHYSVFHHPEGPIQGGASHAYIQWIQRIGVETNQLRGETTDTGENPRWTHREMFAWREAFRKREPLVEHFEGERINGAHDAAFRAGRADDANQSVHWKQLPLDLADGRVLQPIDEAIDEAERVFYTVIPERLRDKIRLKITESIDGGEWGYYRNRLIHASLESWDLARTVFHETIHALRAHGVIGDKDWDKLVQVTNSRRFRHIREEVEAQYKSEGLMQFQMDEEVVARMLDGRFRGETFGKLDAVLDKVLEWFGALKRALGISGFRTARDVFDDISSGRIDEFANPAARPLDKLWETFGDRITLGLDSLGAQRAARLGNVDALLRRDLQSVATAIGIPVETMFHGGRLEGWFAERMLDPGAYGMAHTWIREGQNAQDPDAVINYSPLMIGGVGREASTVAHEFWHTLANFLFNIGFPNHRGGYIDVSRGVTAPESKIAIRPEVRDAIAGVHTALYGEDVARLTAELEFYQRWLKAWADLRGLSHHEYVIEVQGKVAELQNRLIGAATTKTGIFANEGNKATFLSGGRRAREYLQNPMEVTARAFQSWVSDRSGGTIKNHAMWFNKFTDEAEKQRVYAAFDHLFEVLGVRESTMPGAPEGARELYQKPRQGPKVTGLGARITSWWNNAGGRKELTPDEQTLIQNLDALRSRFKDDAWTAFADVDGDLIPHGAGWARIDPASLYVMSPSPGTRAIGGSVLNNAVGMRDHRTNFRPMNLDQMQMESRWLTDFEQSRVGIEQKWAERLGLTPAQLATRRQELYVMAGRAIRSSRHQIDPEAVELLNAFRRVYKEAGLDLMNPLRHEGKEGRPVSGAEYIDPDVYQIPRIYDYNAVADAVAYFGHPEVVKMLAKSHNSERIKRGVEPRDEAELLKFFDMWVDILDDRSLGIGHHRWENAHMGNKDAREALAAQLREKGVDDALIDDMLEWVYPPSGDGKTSAGHLKKREWFDETYVHTVRRNGVDEELHFADILNNDITAISKKYFRQMSGHWAAANVRVELPMANQAGGETRFLVNGWTNQQEIDATIENLIVYNRMHSEKNPSYTAEHIKNEIEKLRFDIDRVLGRPNPAQLDNWAWHLRMTRAFLRTVYLNQVGFAQSSEYGTAIGQVGIKAAMQQSPAFKRFIDPVTGKSLMKRELAQFVEALGSHEHLHGFRWDDIDGIDEMPYGGSPNRFKAGAERLMSAGEHIQNTLSMQNFWQRTQERHTRMWLVQDVANYAAKYRKDNNLDLGVHPERRITFSSTTGFARRMAQLGVGEDMLKRILQQFIDHVGVTEGRLTGELVPTARAWQWTDKEAKMVFERAIWRRARAIIQQGDQGTVPRKLRDDPIMQIIFQFRSFPMVAHANQLNYNIHMGDPRAMATFFWSMASAAIVRAAQVHLTALGRSDYDEYVKKNASVEALALAAFSRSGWSALLPMITDSALLLGGNKEGIFNARTTAQPSNAVLGMPFINFIDRAGRGVGGMTNSLWNLRAPAQTETRDLFSMLPFNNLAGIGNGLSFLVGPSALNLPERPPPRQPQ